MRHIGSQFLIDGLLAVTAAECYNFHDYQVTVGLNIIKKVHLKHTVSQKAIKGNLAKNRKVSALALVFSVKQNQLQLNGIVQQT